MMYAMSNGVDASGTPGFSVWIGAKSEHPLQFLKPMIDQTWDFVAI